MPANINLDDLKKGVIEQIALKVDALKEASAQAVIELIKSIDTGNEKTLDLKQHIVILLVLLTANCSTVYGQSQKLSSSQKESVVKHIIERSTKYLLLDTAAKNNGYNRRIRIIDLSNSLSISGHSFYTYYNHVPVYYINKKTLNYNSGAYRDIVLNNLQFNQDTIRLDAFFYTFGTDFHGVHQPIFTNYIFLKKDARVDVLSTKMTILDLWNGDMEGW